MAGALVALALVVAIGWAAWELVAGPLLGPFALRLAGAFVAGLATLPAMLLAASALGAPVRPALGIGLAALLAAAAVAARRRPAPAAREASPAAPWRAVDVALALVGALFLAVPLAIALLAPAVEWDFVAIWGLKGRVLAHEALAGSPLLHDLARAYAHLDYPLLWPLALAWVWSFAGAHDLVAIQLLGVAVEWATVGLVYGALRDAAGRRAALATAAAVAAIPLLGAKSVRLLADPVVALFLLAFVAAGVRWLERRDGAAPALAGFAAAGLWTTKNEGLGLLLAGVAGLVWAVARTADRPPRRELARAFAPLALVLPWLAVAPGPPRAHHNRGDELLRGASLDLERAMEVVAGLPRYALEIESWGLFWPLALVAALAAARRRPTPAVAGAAFALLAPWPLVALGLAGHELPAAVILDLAASRLILQLAPATAYLLAHAAESAPAAPAG
jgi:hypothetical protein